MSVCPECGGNPMGEGCYHICPNSNHYYSPEQERADDAHYGEADRWEGYGDPEPYYEEDTPEDHGADGGDPDDPPVCYMGHADCYDQHTSQRLADEADWEQERLEEGVHVADAFLTSGPGWPD